MISKKNSDCLGTVSSMRNEADELDKELRERHAKVGKKWAKLKPKANNCPDCGSCGTGLNDRLLHKWKRFYLECENCHWCGRSMPTIRLAVWIWNMDGWKRYTKMLKRIYGGK